ncbi:hypothetical protein [Paracoccus salsus]|uniref:hypothetical protein n=1 Tax=Paracoccus salsus TaxID=2911061 RepID=UPI001F1FABD2|nr:hypothetical protein [Paracoccus salsus]MCF3975111.1 hypothetical protein [Paracoccus salsus]
MSKSCLKPALAGAVLALGVAGSQPAAAQSAACVNLQVGAGYAAWMAVKFAGGFTWSSSFPIGQTRCIPLPVDGMVDGAPYEVVVSAVLGSSKVSCTPAPGVYQSSNTNSVSYNAWGTTLNVHCEMPGAANLEMINALPVTPTEEGMMALEKHNTEGELPPPTE